MNELYEYLESKKNQYNWYCEVCNVFCESDKKIIIEVEQSYNYKLYITYDNYDFIITKHDEDAEDDEEIDLDIFTLNYVMFDMNEEVLYSIIHNYIYELLKYTKSR